MDSKRTYKKIGSFVWWCLVLLPILLSFIYFVGYHLNFNNGMTSAEELTQYHTTGVNAFMYYLSESANTLNAVIPSVIKTPLNNLFSVIYQNTSTEVTLFSNIVAWGVWCILLHLLWDFITFIPMWCHCLIDKLGGKH